MKKLGRGILDNSQVIIARERSNRPMDRYQKIVTYQMMKNITKRVLFVEEMKNIQKKKQKELVKIINGQ